MNENPVLPAVEPLATASPTTPTPVQNTAALQATTHTPTTLPDVDFKVDDNTKLEDIAKPYNDTASALIDLGPKLAKDVSARQQLLVGNNYGPQNNLGTDPISFQQFYQPQLASAASNLRSQGLQKAWQTGAERAQKAAQDRYSKAQNRYSNYRHYQQQKAAQQAAQQTEARNRMNQQQSGKAGTTGVTIDKNWLKEKGVEWEDWLNMDASRRESLLQKYSDEALGVTQGDWDAQYAKRNDPNSPWYQSTQAALQAMGATGDQLKQGTQAYKDFLNAIKKDSGKQKQWDTAWSNHMWKAAGWDSSDQHYTKEREWTAAVGNNINKFIEQGGGSESEFQKIIDQANVQLKSAFSNIETLNRKRIDVAYRVQKLLQTSKGNFKLINTKALSDSDKKALREGLDYIGAKYAEDKNNNFISVSQVDIEKKTEQNVDEESAINGLREALSKSSISTQSYRDIEKEAQGGLFSIPHTITDTAKWSKANINFDYIGSIKTTKEAAKWLKDNSNFKTAKIIGAEVGGTGVWYSKDTLNNLDSIINGEEKAITIDSTDALRDALHMDYNDLNNMAKLYKEDNTKFNNMLGTAMMSMYQPITISQGDLLDTNGNVIPAGQYVIYHAPGDENTASYKQLVDFLKEKPAIMKDGTFNYGWDIDNSQDGSAATFQRLYQNYQNETAALHLSANSMAPQFSDKGITTSQAWAQANAWLQAYRNGDDDEKTRVKGYTWGGSSGSDIATAFNKQDAETKQRIIESLARKAGYNEIQKIDSSVGDMSNLNKIVKDGNRISNKDAAALLYMITSDLQNTTSSGDFKGQFKGEGGVNLLSTAQDSLLGFEKAAGETVNFTAGLLAMAGGALETAVGPATFSEGGSDLLKWGTNMVAGQDANGNTEFKGNWDLGHARKMINDDMALDNLSILSGFSNAHSIESGARTAGQVAEQMAEVLIPIAGARAGAAVADMLKSGASYAARKVAKEATKATAKSVAKDALNLPTVRNELLSNMEKGLSKDAVELGKDGKVIAHPGAQTAERAGRTPTNVPHTSPDDYIKTTTKHIEPLPDIPLGERPLLVTKSGAGDLSKISIDSSDPMEIADTMTGRNAAIATEGKSANVIAGASDIKVPEPRAAQARSWQFSQDTEAARNKKLKDAIYSNKELDATIRKEAEEKLGGIDKYMKTSERTQKVNYAKSSTATEELAGRVSATKDGKDYFDAVEDFVSKAKETLYNRAVKARNFQIKADNFLSNSIVNAYNTAVRTARLTGKVAGATKRTVKWMAENKMGLSNLEKFFYQSAVRGQVAAWAEKNLGRNVKKVIDDMMQLNGRAASAFLYEFYNGDKKAAFNMLDDMIKSGNTRWTEDMLRQYIAESAHGGIKGARAQLTWSKMKDEIIWNSYYMDTAPAHYTQDERNQLMFTPTDQPFGLNWGAIGEHFAQNAIMNFAVSNVAFGSMSRIRNHFTTGHLTKKTANLREKIAGMEVGSKEYVAAMNKLDTLNKKLDATYNTAVREYTLRGASPVFRQAFEEVKDSNEAIAKEAMRVFEGMKTGRVDVSQYSKSLQAKMNPIAVKNSLVGSLKHAAVLRRMQYQADMPNIAKMNDKEGLEAMVIASDAIKPKMKAEEARKAQIDALTKRFSNIPESEWKTYFEIVDKAADQRILDEEAGNVYIAKDDKGNHRKFVKRVGYMPENALRDRNELFDGQIAYTGLGNVLIGNPGSVNILKGRTAKQGDAARLILSRKGMKLIGNRLNAVEVDGMDVALGKLNMSGCNPIDNLNAMQNSFSAYKMKKDFDTIDAMTDSKIVVTSQENIRNKMEADRVNASKRDASKRDTSEEEVNNAINKTEKTPTKETSTKTESDVVEDVSAPDPTPVNVAPGKVATDNASTSKVSTGEMASSKASIGKASIGKVRVHRSYKGGELYEQITAKKRFAKANDQWTRDMQKEGIVRADGSVVDPEEYLLKKLNFKKGDDLNRLLANYAVEHHIYTVKNGEHVVDEAAILEAKIAIGNEYSTKLDRAIDLRPSKMMNEKWLKESGPGLKNKPKDFDGTQEEWLQKRADYIQALEDKLVTKLTKSSRTVELKGALSTEQYYSLARTMAKACVNGDILPSQVKVLDEVFGDHANADKFFEQVTGFKLNELATMNANVLRNRLLSGLKNTATGVDARQTQSPATYKLLDEYLSNRATAEQDGSLQLSQTFKSGQEAANYIDGTMRPIRVSYPGGIPCRTYKGRIPIDSAEYSSLPKNLADNENGKNFSKQHLNSTYARNMLQLANRTKPILVTGEGGKPIGWIGETPCMSTKRKGSTDTVNSNVDIDYIDIRDIADFNERCKKIDTLSKSTWLSHWIAYGNKLNLSVDDIMSTIFNARAQQMKVLRDIPEADNLLSQIQVNLTPAGVNFTGDLTGGVPKVSPTEGTYKANDIIRNNYLVYEVGDDIKKSDYYQTMSKLAGGEDQYAYRKVGDTTGRIGVSKNRYNIMKQDLENAQIIFTNKKSSAYNLDHANGTTYLSRNSKTLTPNAQNYVVHLSFANKSKIVQKSADVTPIEGVVGEKYTAKQQTSTARARYGSFKAPDSDATKIHLTGNLDKDIRLLGLNIQHRDLYRKIQDANPDKTITGQAILSQDIIVSGAVKEDYLNKLIKAVNDFSGTSKVRFDDDMKLAKSLDQILKSDNYEISTLNKTLFDNLDRLFATFDYNSNISDISKLSPKGVQDMLSRIIKNIAQGKATSTPSLIVDKQLTAKNVAPTIVIDTSNPKWFSTLMHEYDHLVRGYDPEPSTDFKKPYYLRNSESHGRAMNVVTGELSVFNKQDVGASYIEDTGMTYQDLADLYAIGEGVRNAEVIAEDAVQRANNPKTEKAKAAEDAGIEVPPEFFMNDDPAKATPPTDEELADLPFFSSARKRADKTNAALTKIQGAASNDETSKYNFVDVNATPTNIYNVKRGKDLAEATVQWKTKIDGKEVEIETTQRMTKDELLQLEADATDGVSTRRKFTKDDDEWFDDTTEHAVVDNNENVGQKTISKAEAKKRDKAEAKAKKAEAKKANEETKKTEEGAKETSDRKPKKNLFDRLKEQWNEIHGKKTDGKKADVEEAGSDKAGSKKANKEKDKFISKLDESENAQIYRDSKAGITYMTKDALSEVSRLTGKTYSNINKIRIRHGDDKRVLSDALRDDMVADIQRRERASGARVDGNVYLDDDVMDMVANFEPGVAANPKNIGQSLLELSAKIQNWQLAGGYGRFNALSTRQWLSTFQAMAFSNPAGMARMMSVWSISKSFDNVRKYLFTNTRKGPDGQLVGNNDSILQRMIATTGDCSILDALADAFDYRPGRQNSSLDNLANEIKRTWEQERQNTNIPKGTKRVVDRLEQHIFEDPTFKRFIPILQLETIAQNYAINLRKLAKKNKGCITESIKNQAMRDAYDTHLMWWGIHPSKKAGFGKHRMSTFDAKQKKIAKRMAGRSNHIRVFDIINQLFFATSYRINGFTRYLNSIVAAVNPKNWKDPSYRMGRGYLASWISVIVAAQIFNQIRNGENAAGMAYESLTDKSRDPNDFWKLMQSIDELGTFHPWGYGDDGKGINLMFSTTTIQNATVRMGVAAFNQFAQYPNKIETPSANWWNEAVNLFQSPIKATIESLLNGTYYGYSIWGENASAIDDDGKPIPMDPLENAKAIMKHILGTDNLNPRGQQVGGSGIFQHEYWDAMTSFLKGDYFGAMTTALEIPVKSEWNSSGKARASLNNYVMPAIAQYEREYNEKIKNASPEEKNKAYTEFAKKALQQVVLWNERYKVVESDDKDALMQQAQRVLIGFLADRYDDKTKKLNSAYVRAGINSLGGFDKKSYETDEEYEKRHQKVSDAWNEQQDREYQARQVLRSLGYDPIVFTYKDWQSKRYNTINNITAQFKAVANGEINGYANLSEAKKDYQNQIQQLRNLGDWDGAKAKEAVYVSLYDSVVSPYIEKYSAAVLLRNYDLTDEMAKYVIIPTDDKKTKKYNSEKQNLNWLRDRYGVGYNNADALISSDQYYDQYRKLIKETLGGNAGLAKSRADAMLYAVSQGKMTVTQKQLNNLVELSSRLRATSK